VPARAVPKRVVPEAAWPHKSVPYVRDVEVMVLKVACVAAWHITVDFWVDFGSASRSWHQNCFVEGLSLHRGAIQSDTPNELSPDQVRSPCEV